MSGSDGVDMVRAYCGEVSRVLSNGGRFIVITHQNPATDAALGVLENAILPGLTQESVNSDTEQRNNKGSNKEMRKVLNRSRWTLDVHSMVISLRMSTLMYPR